MGSQIAATPSEIPMRFAALVLAALGLAGCASVNPFNDENLALARHGGEGGYDPVPRYAEGPQQAVFVKSPEEADLLVYTTWRQSWANAYIGKCQGTADGPTLKLYETDAYYKADIRVHRVDGEPKADYGHVYCLQ
jgi:hypothetical protein